jgi:hypothetical protein
LNGNPVGSRPDRGHPRPLNPTSKVAGNVSNALASSALDRPLRSLRRAF